MRLRDKLLESFLTAKRERLIVNINIQYEIIEDYERMVQRASDRLTKLHTELGDVELKLHSICKSKKKVGIK